MYELRRITPDGYSVLGTAETRKDLEPALQHYLAGPDGPAVGSRYADYEITEVADTLAARIKTATTHIVGRRRKITQAEMAALLRAYMEAGLDQTNDCVQPGHDTAVAWAARCKGITCISVLADRATPHGDVRYDDPGSMHPLHHALVLFAPAALEGMEYDQIRQLRRKADRVLIVV